MVVTSGKRLVVVTPTCPLADNRAVRPVQALERRMQRKKQDSGVARMILVVRGTRRNRDTLRVVLPSLRGTFPLGSRELLQALADGRDPGGDGLLVLEPRPVRRPDR